MSLYFQQLLLMTFFWAFEEQSFLHGPPLYSIHYEADHHRLFFLPQEFNIDADLLILVVCYQHLLICLIEPKGSDKYSPWKSWAFIVD